MNINILQYCSIVMSSRRKLVKNFSYMKRFSAIHTSTIHYDFSQKPTSISDTPLYEVSEEDQDMMQQLQALYKMPCFWSNPQPPTLSLLLLLFNFQADVGRKCACLKMKRNKSKNKTKKRHWMCWPHFVIHMTFDGGIVLK